MRFVTVTVMVAVVVLSMAVVVVIMLMIMLRSCRGSGQEHYEDSNKDRGRFHGLAPGDLRFYRF